MIASGQLSFADRQPRHETQISAHPRCQTTLPGPHVHGAIGAPLTSPPATLTTSTRSRPSSPGTDPRITIAVGETAPVAVEVDQLHFFDPHRRVDQASRGPVPGVARAQVSMSSCRSQWAEGPAWV